MRLHALEQGRHFGYTTFGCMWKQGECREDTTYICTAEGEDGNVQEVPVQSRVTAYWPDGTVKWTAHTGDAARLGDKIQVQPGVAAPCREGIRYQETEEELILQAGTVLVKIRKVGSRLFETVEQQGKVCLEAGEAVLLLEKPVQVQGLPGKIKKEYQGLVEQVTLEERGFLRAIVRYDGIHVSKDGERKIPFVIRMEVGYQNPNLKFIHTFLYDGDENQDFLKGLGIRFQSPLAGALYNRHVKFTGDHGVFHETLVPLTSWRPRVPEEIYRRQMAGEKLLLEGTDKEIVEKVLQDVPYWSEYDLCQDSVSHFGIRKKQRGDHLCAIDCLHGVHTAGGAAFGSESGSVMVAVRDFWEKYPSGITFQGLEGEEAACTLWFWSPGAPAMDFRHYADRGYNQVCYEGYDYKGADPVGIACTTECAISFSGDMIPADGEVEAFAAMVNHPPVYVGTPRFYHEMRAFGYWSLPSYETEMERWLEGQLEAAFAFYSNEVEQRGWYGMFNYGDVMHTYDGMRHEWKYDIGGFAWDNTELVPTLWLWQYFLHTGRADVFRIAERLSRHTSEVDVYHIGKYKGLGSRHNVRHWGCPCKEARIAMASHHRYYYYLTGDRRMEDIFEELKDNEYSFLNKDPLGDFFDKKDMVYPSHARSGPDWSSLCSNWMTRWERFNDTRYRDKILTGIEDLKKAPLKLVSGPDFEFDPATCHLRYIGERTTGGCHLQVCMGAPAVWTEMADLLGDEEWKRMIADLGRFYYLPRREQIQESGGLIGDREFTLPLLAAAVAAYGAWYLQDEVLAERTWRVLLQALLKGPEEDLENGTDAGESLEGFDGVLELENTGNQALLREIPWVTTNFTAQFCLNTIMALDFIREQLPATMQEARRLAASGDGEMHHKA